MTDMPRSPRHLATRILAALAAVLLLGPAASHAQEASVPRWTTTERVVAFGDVHGAYDELVALLKTTGLVGDDLQWTGGTTVAVSLGDLLDRGPESRQVMDLLMRLQREAGQAGGRLHVILGNHEAMNLIGDLRYLVPEDYAAFAADETDAMREEAFAEFRARGGATVPGAESPPAGEPAAAVDEAALREAFDRSYPRGFFARHAALAPDGVYGKWLLSLPTVIVVNDTAYVHGGPSRLVGEAGFELNDRTRRDLLRYLELRRQLADTGLLPKWDMRRDRDIALAARDTATPEMQALIAEFIALEEAPELGTNGPFWYRGSIYCKPMLEESVLDAALARFGAKRFVVGHTPTGDRRVHGLYGGRLVMLDTGMLGAYYEGRPAALVTEGGETWVQYAQPAERAAIDLSGNVQDYGRTEAALREVLAQGVVTVSQKGADGAPWAVTVRNGNQDVAALFYPDGVNELAAAALDDLLGASLVPPTVAREVEGVEGALQLSYPGAISEAQRMERGVGLSSFCPLQQQLGLMYTFDLLIANRSRSVENILFAHQRSNLVLTGHREAFGADRSLPQGFDRAKLEIPPPMATALRNLDEPTLESVLGAWIGKREIRALLSRRDQLLGD
jgi:hypothetical protein